MKKDSFIAKLHSREYADSAVRSKSYRKLYTDRQLINELDIVNELDGHSGCVNALSWSKSGKLLASGSDDHSLNLYSYQPDSTAQQFRLAASVSTGHTQNIFSVKFMPHSNDRTVITAAGDAQVRIFDLEHSGRSATASAASTLATARRRARRSNFYDGVRYLSDGDTNARVYKSHADRVKRIVTESSPHLFLTCSEDGEVRQWDLRQPSSAYPEPQGSRYSYDSSVPPPLISYKRYNLDLNTISCSASQPHYIALGGAHLHAFLHDRRMSGRDRLKEMGRPLSPVSRLSLDEQEMLAQATQCVKKFAPTGQRRMKRSDNGHITACKISDARPDEMIVSWSGDHIYSFDLHRDPGTEEELAGPLHSDGVKRKRKANGSETSLAQEARASSRPRREGTQDATLRIRYRNGQSEDVSLPTRSAPLTERQREAQRTANAVVKIRSSIFGRVQEGRDLEEQCTTALDHAAGILCDMDDVMRNWGYPVAPTAEQVYVQRNMRRNRESTRRFVQAAGTLARALGGNPGSNPMMSQFAVVEVRNNDLELSRQERFLYDFLRAILLWLDSGLERRVRLLTCIRIGRLIEGFTRPRDMPATTKLGGRLPIPEADASPEAVDEILVPYLSSLASDVPILNLEKNRFETDERRQLFGTQREAVSAFALAVRTPFADLSSDEASMGNAEVQDRHTAVRYWGAQVARGLLWNAAQSIKYSMVDHSFGGSGRVTRDVIAEEDILESVGNDQDEAERAFEAAEILDETGQVLDGATADDISSARPLASHDDYTILGDEHSPDITDLGGDRSQQEDLSLAEDSEAENDESGEHENVGEEQEDDDDDDNDDDDERSSDSSEADEEDGVPNMAFPGYIYRSALERRRLRPQVEADINCVRSTRKYFGHCNVRTVKDVNYFGPDDEYVVSGSDCGNLFIWDRKTSELVNILEGDGEVVNVIQGHPYETMLAVSGIDHTIKIFSPDARARQDARLGEGVCAHDNTTFSSIELGRRRQRRRESDEPNGPSSSEPATADADEEYVAPNGLSSRKRMKDSYRIMHNNNVEREGGNRDAIISLPHAQLLQLLFGQLGNVGFMPSFE